MSRPPLREPSLQDRILAFFRAQPDEELHPEDIAEKFDAPLRRVTIALGDLKRRGLIEVVVRRISS